ncbi:MAG: SRPBCC family protein [Steroidobacteraceae bacterium]
MNFLNSTKSKRGHKSLRCEQWGNLIFVNRNPDAQPLLEYLGPLTRDLADFDLDNIKLFKKVTKDISSNWKVLIDAFQEIYHFQRVHPQTNLMLDMDDRHVQLPWPEFLHHYYARGGPEYREESAAFYAVWCNVRNALQGIGARL